MTNIDTASQQALMEQMLKYKFDPAGFARVAFPWGKAGTPLEHFKGPRGWQMDELEQFGDHLREQHAKQSVGLPLSVYQSALASGRGIGKSALNGMITMYFMSCWWGSSTIITANTEGQLITKTWPEVSKWYRLCATKDWFDVTATKLVPAKWFAEILRDQLRVDTAYYYAQIQTWSEENPDAFAGAHNMAGLLLLMDEASGIPAPIWSVAKGFFTEPVVNRAHIAISNPRRPEGAFFECFHKNRAFWKTRHIDARSVEGTDPQVYEEMIQQYGDDSDVVRVEVKGVFPSQSEDAFISRTLAEGAANRVPDTTYSHHFPLIMGVDVAGLGKDYTVFAFRQGSDAVSIPWKVFRGLEAPQVVAHIAKTIDELKPDAVFVDGDGMGAPIIQTMRSTLKYKIITPVRSGLNSIDKMYKDERSRMYGQLKDWLPTGSIPDIPRLIDDLIAPRLEYYGPNQTLKLESKKDMRTRGLPSTDYSDPLAYTFFRPVANRSANEWSKTVRQKRLQERNNTEYNVLDF